MDFKSLIGLEVSKATKVLNDFGYNDIEEVKNSNGKIYKYHIYNKNECGKEFVLIESEILRQLKKVYR